MPDDVLLEIVEAEFARCDERADETPRRRKNGLDRAACLGRNGATPTRQTRRPLSRSFCDIVERSHFTKNDFSGLSPRRAPFCHSLSRKSEMVERTLAQSSSPLGSNTAHWVPLSIERSRKAKYRRRLTYFHSGSLDIVRAPHRRLPRPSKKRKQLMPSGLRTSWCAFVSMVSKPTERLTTSLAGAL
jgi:hypothetical protein